MIWKESGKYVGAPKPTLTKITITDDDKILEN